MRTITRKIGHCRCMKEWMISGVRALANRHPMMPCAILKGSRDKRIAACPVPTGMPAIIEASIRAASAALVLPEFTMPRFQRVDSALSLVQAHRVRQASESGFSFLNPFHDHQEIFLSVSWKE